MKTLTRNDPPIVFHFRIGKGTETQPKAGATVVYHPVANRFGIALCCEKDRYCRRWGRRIAEVRAKLGKRTHIPNRRFESSVPYDGPLDMEQIRLAARRLVRTAAIAVDNPLGSNIGMLK